MSESTPTEKQQELSGKVMAVRVAPPTGDPGVQPGQLVGVMAVKWTSLRSVWTALSGISLVIAFPVYEIIRDPHFAWDKKGLDLVVHAAIVAFFGHAVHSTISNNTVVAPKNGNAK